jgi:hypothetical protein
MSLVVSVETGMQCRKCKAAVRHDRSSDFYSCHCTDFQGGGLMRAKPTAWYWRLPPGSFQPADDAGKFDPSKCLNCKKDLAIVGLNKTYPPKRNAAGDPICPHCGHVQMPGVSGFSTFSIDTPGRLQWTPDGNDYLRMVMKELEKSMAKRMDKIILGSNDA